jgi:hypothetical protein
VEKKNRATHSSFRSASNAYNRLHTTISGHRNRRVKDKVENLTAVPGTIGYELSKQSQSHSNVFQVSNKDRFGDNVMPKKPLEVRPPPGAYENVIPRKRIKNAAMGKVDRGITKVGYKAPGPAYYKPMVEPKSTSYHLNVQNRWMC